MEKTLQSKNGPPTLLFICGTGPWVGEGGGGGGVFCLCKVLSLLPPSKDHFIWRLTLSWEMFILVKIYWPQ